MPNPFVDSGRRFVDALTPAWVKERASEKKRNEAASAVDIALQGYCEQQATRGPTDRFPLDSDRVTALCERLQCFSLTELRECQAAEFLKAYKALVAAAGVDANRFMDSASEATRSPEQVLGGLQSTALTVRQGYALHELGMAWRNAIVIEFELNLAASRYGAVHRTINSPLLRSGFASGMGECVLRAIAAELGTKPVASLVIAKVLNAWRSSEYGKGRVGFSERLAHLLESQKATRRELCDQRGGVVAGDVNGGVPGSAAAQSLWLHMVSVLIPTLEDGEGLARLLQDRTRLEERLAGYSATPGDRFYAMRDLAAWFPVPPIASLLSNAVLLWCYWNAIDPERAIRVCYVDGVRFPVLKKTFDRFTPLANKSINRTQCEAWIVRKGYAPAASEGGRLGKPTCAQSERIANGSWEAWDAVYVPSNSDEEQEEVPPTPLSCDVKSGMLEVPGVWDNVVRSLEEW